MVLDELDVFAEIVELDELVHSFVSVDRLLELCISWKFKKMVEWMKGSVRMLSSDSPVRRGQICRNT